MTRDERRGSPSLTRESAGSETFAAGTSPGSAGESGAPEGADEAGRDLSAELSRAERELEEMRGMLHQLSYRDGLTGLLNHRALCERLERELSVARQEDCPLAVLFGDIDHFSLLNSELGHAFGDGALVEVARILAQGEERGAIAGRYGGEEFAVLLPRTDKVEAAERANRLRDQIASQAFADGRALTVSFGVAAFPEDGDDLESLIRSADGALRAAKQRGRNRVHRYDGGPAAREADAEGGAAGHRGAGASAGEDRFPTPRTRFRALASALERDRSLSCLYIDLSALSRIEIEHGVPKHAEVIEQVGLILESARGDRLRRDDAICRAEHGDAYICFLSPSRTRSATLASDLERVAGRVEELLERGLGDDVHALIRERPRIPVGFSRVLKNPMLRAERLIDRLIGEARHAAELQRQRAMQLDKNLVQEIILHDQVGPVYQPIVELETAETFGYESLSRGPSGTSLESPAALFTVADNVGLTFELDRACFRGALRGAVGLEPVHHLFVNLLPLSFYDPSFIESEISKLLYAAGLTPSHVVFEITERLAIENFSSFRRVLGSYTEMGFGVAIDDVGTRHSNLESVMALKPQFIKISDVLTRGVSRSTVRREMLRSLGRIAQTIDAAVIAEGIETPDDLAVLLDLGVRFGQGYFLGRPAPAFPTVAQPVERAVRALSVAGAPPIPAPPADADDDEEVQRHASRAVRDAVLDRAHRSGELAAADAENIAAALGDDGAGVAGAAPDPAPSGTPADLDEPAESEESGERAPARRGMPLVASESKPVAEGELGRSPRERNEISLMESLRAGERRADPSLEEESTAGGTAAS